MAHKQMGQTVTRNYLALRSERIGAHRNARNQAVAAFHHTS